MSSIVILRGYKIWPQIEKGNKAAGTRARKSSLELEKAMKEFRKLSLEQSKL